MMAPFRFKELQKMLMLGMHKSYWKIISAQNLVFVGMLTKQSGHGAAMVITMQKTQHRYMLLAKSKLLF